MRISAALLNFEVDIRDTQLYLEIPLKCALLGCLHEARTSFQFGKQIKYIEENFSAVNVHLTAHDNQWIGGFGVQTSWRTLSLPYTEFGGPGDASIAILTDRPTRLPLCLRYLPGR